MGHELWHIGHAAQAVGLSLRTIRYYEEIGLVVPSGRSAGGFRLYNGDDIERLLLIKRMKPLGYPLEEMARLLALIDAVDGLDPGGVPSQASTGESATAALETLRAYAEAVEQRVVDLETKVEYAREFRQRLHAQIARRLGAPDGEGHAAPSEGSGDEFRRETTE